MRSPKRLYRREGRNVGFWGRFAALYVVAASFFTPPSGMQHRVGAQAHATFS